MAFKPIKSICGNEPAVILEFPIATSTAIKQGAVVKLSAGKVVLSAGNDAILGVAVEKHAASKDMFAPYSGTDKIAVYCDPNQVFEVPVGEVTASGGSATTVTYVGVTTDDLFNNSLIQDADGKVGAITDSSYASSGTVTTLTFASGVVAAGEDGKKYKIYPEVGFTYCVASGTYKDEINAAVKATTAAFVVVGRDTDKGTLLVKPIKHAFGVGQ